jgi:hypothetical protein
MVVAGNRRLEPSARKYAIESLRLIGPMAGIQATSRISDAASVDLRNRIVVGHTQKQPAFQHALQFLAASLEGSGVGPDAGNRRDLAVERSVVFDDLVPRLMHGGPDVRRQHDWIISSSNVARTADRGNVGIGTTSRPHRLTVGGAIGRGA